MKTLTKKNIWHKMKVSTSNLFDTYAAKYGTGSDYAEVQKIEYSDPEVKTSLAKALTWVNLQTGDTVLHIGVNNGYEISLVKQHYKNIWLSLSMIGIDLVWDALKEAVKNFSSDTNVRFVHGDARNFAGIDVASDRKVVVEEGSVDAVIALTSLQSSSFQNNLDVFVEDLLSKLAPNARLLIAVPDCHVVDGHMVKGQFNANTQKVEYTAAQEFCDALTVLLAKKGFSARTTGEYFKFLVFSRN